MLKLGKGDLIETRNYCGSYYFLVGLNKIYHFPSNREERWFYLTKSLKIFSLNFRIVRNKAAEKAKHVHHHQQHHVSQSLGGGHIATESVDSSTGTIGEPQPPTSNSSANSVNTNVSASASVHASIPTSGTDSVQVSVGHINANSNETTHINSTAEQRTTGYSINGILGIQHGHHSHNNNNNSSVNNNNNTESSCKRKRIEAHGEFYL